jgi:hypothetical protein
MWHEVCEGLVSIHTVSERVIVLMILWLVLYLRIVVDLLIFFVHWILLLLLRLIVSLTMLLVFIKVW